jgi:hypothetical protein
MINNKELDVLIQIGSAMLFKVTCNMRFVFLDYLPDSKVLMYFYFEKEPSKIENELMKDIGFELRVASEYVGEYEYKYFVSLNQANDVEKLRFLIYARFEDFGQYDDE